MGTARDISFEALIIQFVANKMGHPYFGHPVFTKNINTSAWSFLDKYRVNFILAVGFLKAIPLVGVILKPDFSYSWHSKPTSIS